MIVTKSTTLRQILTERPDAIQIFLKHGVDVPSECDESVHDCELELCESMCHIDDIDALIRDVQAFMDAPPAKV